MAEPRCEYCSMISLFTFDASKVSCVIFSQKHKSFHHHCDHVLLVLLWIYIFIFFIKCLGIAMRVKYVHQRQRRFQITLLSILERPLTFWMPKWLHHFFDLHVFVMNLFSADMAQCWYAYVTTVKMRARDRKREDRNLSSEFLQKLDLFHHKSGQLHYVVLF